MPHKADQNILSLYPANRAVEAPTPTIPVACPHCGHKGTFTAVGKPYGFFTHKEAGGTQHLAISVRVCPNTDCLKAVVFVSQDKTLVAAFPPLRIKFQTAGIPQTVKECLEEAIVCHATGAHRASALMVRRTLEELCEERGAAGPNLKKRLEALGAKIVLPKDLFPALDELRLLGNDAAHIEARVYEDIGPEETEIAIEATQEILKAAYQYVDLVAKLRSLKNGSSAE